MKLFGSITEFVSTVFKKNSQAITLRPNQTSTYTASRDIQLPEGDTAHILVSRTSTDTLTNKTLTSPAITTPTGIVKGDVGLGNVDNTSDATKNAASVTLTNKTLTSPIVGTDAQFANQAIAKFYEQTGNGTNYIGLEAPDAVTADKTFKLPNGDGSAGQVLKTDGSLALGWVTALTDPMTTRGDTIVRNSSNATARLAVGAANRVLASDGTDPSWAQITSTGFFTTGAEVTQSAPGVVKSAGQLKGTNTNDSAGAGYVGEIVEVFHSTFDTANTPGSGSWAGVTDTNASITAGDWIAYSHVNLAQNGAIFTDDCLMAISVNSGNTTTDHVDGDNQAYIGTPNGTSPGRTSNGISGYRISVSSTTTVYFKLKLTYTTATPKLSARLRLVRIR